ncbi:MAG: hypothetical protein M3Y74_03325 [Chloroflexota bacterium]|nr:hypothetical protein [Chloroflexota bacterium]
MQPTTIPLISSPHPNWIRLQSILQKQRHLQVIRAVGQCDEAVRAVTVEQPDVIIADSDLPTIPIVPLVEEVRAASPASRIIAVGKLREREEHVRLTVLGVRSFLLWEDVTADTVGRVIEDVRAGLRVTSDAAAERTIIPPILERRRKPRGCDIVLTDGRLDGLSDLGMLFRIAWPLSKGVVLTVAVLVFMTGWDDFLWPLVVEHAQNFQTATQVVGLFVNGGQSNGYVTWQLAMAAVLAVPVIAAYVFGQKYFVEGIATTGLK